MPEANVVEFYVIGSNINRLWTAAHDAVSGGLLSGNRRWDSTNLELVEIEQDEMVIITNGGVADSSQILTWRGHFKLTVHGLFEAP